MAADANSATGRIEQAIATVIRGLKLDPAPTVAMRKKLVTQDGDGPLMILVEVADSEAFEPIGYGSTAVGKPQLTWVGKRPCGVALGYANSGRQGDNPTLREHRGAIEDALTMGALQRAGLNTPLAVANDVQPSGRQVFDHTQKSQGTDWSVMTFTIETLEDRPYGI